eukprot:scpid92978/ scgid29219/ 
MHVTYSRWFRPRDLLNIKSCLRMEVSSLFGISTTQPACCEILVSALDPRFKDLSLLGEDYREEVHDELRRRMSCAESASKESEDDKEPPAKRRCASEPNQSTPSVRKEQSLLSRLAGKYQSDHPVSSSNPQAAQCTRGVSAVPRHDRLRQ